MKYSVSLGSGVIAGVAAAIISHPADTLLSKINKAGAGGTGSTATRLVNIAKEVGFVKLCTTGLGARCVMIGTLTAGQFGERREGLGEVLAVWMDQSLFSLSPPSLPALHRHLRHRARCSRGQEVPLPRPQVAPLDRRRLAAATHWQCRRLNRA